MTYYKSIAPVTEGSEEPFGIEEIIYSRTDKRGVILAANEVFRRVSRYEWDRLIGAPHRILRNPDTPRGVFHLMWKTIQAGNPICALVKNRSALGGWYWVTAVVVPVEDGYISLRIKPGGEVFSKTKAIYAALVAAEQSRSLSPEDSANQLLATVMEAGFDSYHDFMTTLLQQSMAGRDMALRNASGPLVQALSTLGSHIKATREEQRALVAEFENLQSVPTNMRIIASRLEPTGGPISAISDNYKYASAEIARKLDAFAGTESNQCRLMVDIIGEAILRCSIAQIISELVRQYDREDQGRTPVRIDAEVARLVAVENQYVEASWKTILRIKPVAAILNESSTEIRRMTLGLDTIRVMGKVESGHLGPDGGGLASTIDQLDGRHAVIARHLQRMMDLSAGIGTVIATFSRNRIAQKP